jgi:Family of unknown function (DUF5678)
LRAIQTLNEELLKGIARGTWVAISRDQKRVVGTGETIDEALRHSLQNGEETPFIIRVPLENDALIA